MADTDGGSNSKRKLRSGGGSEEVAHLKATIAQLEKALADKDRVNVVVYGTLHSLELLCVCDQSPTGQARLAQTMEQLEKMDPFLGRGTTWKVFTNLQINLSKTLEQKDKSGLNKAAWVNGVHSPTSSSKPYFLLRTKNACLAAALFNTYTAAFLFLVRNSTQSHRPPINMGITSAVRTWVVHS